MREIVVGRLEADKKKLGMAGTIFIGKTYVKMGRLTTLANDVYLDVAGAHVVFIVGKRGGGKSYTMGVIAEGMADLPMEVKQNLSFIFLDTMGVYWTMKYPNKQQPELLDEWGLKGKPVDIRIYTPYVFYEKFKSQGIPTDAPFALKPSELDAGDWQMTFEINANDPKGVLIDRTIYKLKKEKGDYSIEDIIKAVQADDKAEQQVKDAVENRFLGTESWGVFAETGQEGTPLNELAAPGQITVLDLTPYATMPNGWKVKHLIVGIVSQKLFIQRMVARKKEEFDMVHSTMSYFSTEDLSNKKQDMPLVWLIVDEAHEFLPVKGKTSATDPLVTIMREGRQPGISLILATQQPGKIHTDVMTQSDTVIAHRITAKIDTEALGALMQSYMREGLDVQLDNLPRVKGAAIVFDDANEKMYPMKIRPRFTWHGGSSPVAVKPKKEKV